DGWINVGAANQANWLKLVTALEHPELDDDPRFGANDRRMANLPALVEALTPLFEARTTADWLARFEAVGLPAGPVLDVMQMHADPQTLAREMVLDTDHPTLGRVQSLGHPVKYSATPVEVNRAAPLFGQHSREVLAELGYDEAAIESLVAEGAVVAA
ncbi:MAG: CoA transferase, partial [Planctomycetes bacterium]|nr:CoA transferase [Planctomycetota bacterium]